MAGLLPQCAWLDQMSAQPAGQEQDFRLLFEDVQSRPDKQDGPLVDKPTNFTRDRVWELWKGFTRLSKRNSSLVWEQFLMGSDAGLHAIKVFLQSYVRNAVQMRIVLDEREFAKVRTVTNASAVVAIWRSLVAAADYHVMEPKRRGQPKKARMWRLLWLHNIEGRLEGPAFKVVLWIYEELALEENLLLDSPYQKIAATPSAVETFLRNLWVLAAYIRCNPLTRLLVDVVVLLSALGGFRPKSLRTMTFSQFQLAFITLPDGRTRLACEVRVKRIKVKRRQRCNRKISPWIVFTVLANPNPLFDLPDRIAALGIKMNAFSAGFTSPEDLYTWPLREKARYVPLKWKESMLDKCIIDISDVSLYNVWNRTCVVSGARDPPRFYCLRVGAGGRTIGALGEVLHCYIFSNSIDVFKQSYQASLSANLMELLTEEARQDQPFLAAPADFFFTGDEDAPIDLTADELSQFELRNDITTFRSEINENTGRARALPRDRCKNRIRKLTELKLNVKRAQFFDQIDDHMARGSPTGSIRSKAREERTTLSLTTSGAAISQFLLGPSSGNRHAQADDMPADWAGNKRWMELLGNLRVPQSRVPSPAPRAGHEFQCLLCDKQLTTRTSLSRHVEMHAGELLRPHKCRACAACGKDIEVAAGSVAWSIHCATFHGSKCTPKPADAIPCFCGSSISHAVFANHMNSKHAKLSGQVSCKECESHLPSMDVDEWLEHLQAHQLAGCRSFQRCPLCKRVCQDVHRHLTRTHKKEFEKPFSCPDCGREVVGLDAYEAHVLESHTKEGASLPVSYPSAVSDDEYHEYGLSNNDMVVDTASDDTGLDNIETSELMDKILDRVHSLGWSDGESLGWMRELRTRIMQTGSHLAAPPPRRTVPLTTSRVKRRAEEILSLEKLKRSKLLHSDVDKTVIEDGGMASGDDGDDGSDWDKDDDSSCSSDAWDDEEGTLAPVFEGLIESARKRAT
ncbi:hypothetical protein B0T14DRAFT_127641 [Immersiella caudata]|uniref:C2H2-type domain-containing protein n=1 Tax=Immersiella caudata TaxID=314043 RepID=A0AA40C753_9PEZI|nr:hypothetical protein B0T14DRAFT_127641 [Immersiella caudata]